MPARSRKGAAQQHEAGRHGSGPASRHTWKPRRAPTWRSGRSDGVMEPWPARVVAMPVAGFLGWNWNRTSPPARSAMAGTVSPSFRVPAARVCRSAVHLGAVVGDVQAGQGAPLSSRPYRVATPTPLRNRAGQREPRQDGSSEAGILAESQPLRKDRTVLR